jgi:DNA (cytosine-5)-methyltransferase 1
MNGRAYYNEIEPFAAAWLRNLIAAGRIAPGDVDERSIVDVSADDIRDYTQCHFFAGIAGWSLALHLAGWPDDRPVWTGSCPCQPLSSAGRRKGHADERHLWPAFYRLIAERRPPVIAGEQVASKDGREWLAGVRADLEDMDYAFGAADLCAAGVGAPHIRQRLYWVADSNQARRSVSASWSPRTKRDWSRALDLAGGPSSWLGEGEPRRFEDGSRRRTKSGVDMLVHGFPGRVAAVGAFGNAIVPQVAAQFIGAYLDLEREGVAA